MKPVRNKADFYRRFYAGEFGNHGPMWDSLEGWEREHDPNGLYAIRTLSVGGRCDYNIKPQDIPSRTHALHLDGWRHLNWSQMIPDIAIRTQGEFTRSAQTGILELNYSSLRVPMRQALRERSRAVRGAEATAILRNSMNGASYDWSAYLLDAYPDHVIEYSALEFNWGSVRGQNTLIWEVRQY